MINLKEKIKNWYKGEPYTIKSNPEDRIRFFTVRYKRHWTSKLAHIFVKFYLEHWKWLWTTLIAVLTFIFKFY